MQNISEKQREMSTEEISLVSPQNGINSQLLFQDDPLRFSCTGQPAQQQQQRRVGDPKTRELTGFIDDNKLFSSTTTATATSTAGSDRYFPSHHHHHHQDFPRNVYQREPQGTSGDDTDGDDDEDEEEEEDEEEADDVDGGDGDHENGVDVLVAAIDCNSKNINCNNNNCSGNNSNASNSVHLDKIGNGNAKPKHLSSSFGISGEMVKDGIGGGGLGQTGNNAVTIAEADGEIYYSQYLQATEGSAAGGKDMGVENGCGFSGRKDVSAYSSESGDSLRAILSDPVTGDLMDDAMILPCGHSFGSGGIQHTIKMKVCYSCSQSISEDSIAPNLSLRTAIQAFRREAELQFYRSSKRRRERFDQDKGGYGDSGVMDPPRGRGVQFPFAVTDRVIIKGNKRTPQRFVGREAVVTTQCLNGWYVVKTLDNAESVKLQYRSLAKLSDDPSSKTISTKIVPNWL